MGADVVSSPRAALSALVSRACASVAAVVGGVGVPKGSEQGGCVTRNGPDFTVT